MRYNMHPLLKAKRFLSILFITILLSQPVIAITDTQLDIFAENNIMFYDPDENPCVDGGSISINTANLPPSTISKLENEHVKELAEQNMERYQYGANATGLPWQALAALHYAEGSMDPGNSLLNGVALGSGKNVDELWVYDDANKDAESAATHLVEMAKSVYSISLSPSSSLEDWAWAFLAYNRGFLYKMNNNQSYDVSPYVMNYYDENHQDMEWTWADSYNARTGERVNPAYDVWKVYKKAGALVVFIYLSGGTSSSESSLGTATSLAESNSTHSADGSNVTIIGDSITYFSRSEILNKFPNADITSEGGRSFGTGINIASDPTNDASYSFNDTADDDGKLSSGLRKNVVIALGSNNEDGLNDSDIASMISAIGPDKNIYFVTNYMSPSTTAYADKYDSIKAGYDKNNAAFKKAASENANVYLIDWEAKVQSGSYLEPDGLHPKGEGQKLFAELIYNAINTSTNTTICDPSGAITPWSGDIPWYNQCGTDKQGRSYMETKVGNNGYPDPNGYIVCHTACGIFSMASILTMLTNTEVHPDTLLDYVGKDGQVQKNPNSNYGWTTFDSIDSYQKFISETYGKTLTVEEVNKNNFNEPAYINQVNNALRNGKFVWIAGTEHPAHTYTPFSEGGHFVAIRGVDASGNWLIIDPNGVTYGKPNTFEKSFDPSKIYENVYDSGTKIIGIN